MEKSPIIYYDIILDPAAYPGSPNPWKTRYALNFAKVSYRTTWVPLPDISKTRDSFKLAANRKHYDGRDFPTLPIIQDGDLVLGDSFEIALYLQEKYISADPDGGCLFPPNTVALQRAFNAQVNELFSIHGAPLGGCYMPFDPRTVESDKADMLRRIPGLTSWEQLEIPAGSELRNSMLKKFEEAMDTTLSPCFPGGGGPFMDGNKTPMYADLIVGGWLQFMRLCMPEWDDFRNTWSGGKWGRLFDALEQWSAVDGREGVVPKRQ